MSVIETLPSPSSPPSKSLNSVNSTAIGINCLIVDNEYVHRGGGGSLGRYCSVAIVRNYVAADVDHRRPRDNAPFDERLISLAVTDRRSRDLLIRRVKKVSNGELRRELDRLCRRKRVLAVDALFEKKVYKAENVTKIEKLTGCAVSDLPSLQQLISVNLVIDLIRHELIERNDRSVSSRTKFCSMTTTNTSSAITIEPDIVNCSNDNNTRPSHTTYINNNCNRIDDRGGNHDFIKHREKPERSVTKSTEIASKSGVKSCDDKSNNSFYYPTIIRKFLDNCIFSSCCWSAAKQQT